MLPNGCLSGRWGGGLRSRQVAGSKFKGLGNKFSVTSNTVRAMAIPNKHAWAEPWSNRAAGALAARQWQTRGDGETRSFRGSQLPAGAHRARG